MIPEQAREVRDRLTAAVMGGSERPLKRGGRFSRKIHRQLGLVLRAVDAVDSLLDSAKIEMKDDHVPRVRGGCPFSSDAASMVTVLLQAVRQTSIAAHRIQSMNNLRQLMLAFCTPITMRKARSRRRYCLYGPDGKTPYSWRVALLPYLDQAALYAEYRKDERWDSENNKRVLEKMPAVFRDPNDPAESNFSSYFGLTGPSTVFFGKDGAKIQQILDGTSNTLLLVEAKRDIPWTKPEDIPYSQDEPLPKLGGRYDGVFLAVFCDGVRRDLSKYSDEAMLRAIITPGGGEPVNLPPPGQ